MNSTAQAQQSYQQKIMLIRGRFKNTKDLLVYMTERRKYQPPLYSHPSFPCSRLPDALLQSDQTQAHPGPAQQLEEGPAPEGRPFA